MDKTTLQMAMKAMSDASSVAKEVAKKLGIMTATLYVYVYVYVHGDGSPLEVGYSALLGF